MVGEMDLDQIVSSDLLMNQLYVNEDWIRRRVTLSHIKVKDNWDKG